MNESQFKVNGGKNIRAIDVELNCLLLDLDYGNYGDGGGTT